MKTKPAPEPADVLRSNAYKGVEAALRRAGRPLSRSELRAALKLEANDSRLLHGMVGRAPFVEVSSHTWGLVDRDVPGGTRAFEIALAALDADACITPKQACSVVRGASAVHARWSHDLMLSAYRVWKARRAAFTEERSGTCMPPK